MQSKYKLIKVRSWKYPLEFGTSEAGHSVWGFQVQSYFSLGGHIIRENCGVCFSAKSFWDGDWFKFVSCLSQKCPNISSIEPNYIRNKGSINFQTIRKQVQARSLSKTLRPDWDLFITRLKAVGPNKYSIFEIEKKKKLFKTTLTNLVIS